MRKRPAHCPPQLAGCSPHAHPIAKAMRLVCVAGVLACALLLVACERRLPAGMAGATQACVYAQPAAPDGARFRIDLAAPTCATPAGVPVYGAGYTHAQLRRAATEADRILACAEGARTCPEAFPEDAHGLVARRWLQGAMYTGYGFLFVFRRDRAQVGEIFVPATGPVRVGISDAGDGEG